MSAAALSNLCSRQRLSSTPGRSWPIWPRSSSPRGPGRAAVASVRVEATVGAPATVPASADRPTPGRWAARGERAGRMALPLLSIGALFHLGAVVARGFAAGRAPWGNMFEFATVGALVAAGAFLVLQRKYDVRYLGVWVSARRARRRRVRGHRALHRGRSAAAGAAIDLARHPRARRDPRDRAVHPRRAGVAALPRRRPAAPARPGGSAPTSRVCRSRPALDRLAFRLHAVAFPIWTFAVMAGAVWAQYAWGRYWGWDPKETWAFVSWVVYAAYLHARVDGRLEGPLSGRGGARRLRDDAVQLHRGEHLPHRLPLVRRSVTARPARTGRENVRWRSRSRSERKELAGATRPAGARHAWPRRSSASSTASSPTSTRSATCRRSSGCC